MFRLGTHSFAVLLIAVATVTSANPPDEPDSRFNKALSVQAAMARARILLNEKDAQKAVDVLEEQLPKVNGNTEYLVLLRDAYRVYVRDLYLAGKAEHAKRYLDRLSILDPNAVNDPALKPVADAQPRKFEQEQVKQTKLTFPTWNPFTKKEQPKAEPQTVIRALPADSINEDPFDRKNRREVAEGGTKQTLARDLLSRGAWSSRTNATARPASISSRHSTEPASIDSFREQWAAASSRASPMPWSNRARCLASWPTCEASRRASRWRDQDDVVVGQQLLTQLEERSKRPVVLASVEGAALGPEQRRLAESLRHRTSASSTRNRASTPTASPDRGEHAFIGVSQMVRPRRRRMAADVAN